MAKSPYRAMRELEARLCSAYARLLEKILARVHEYAARNLVEDLGDLGKAHGPYRALVTPAALAEVRRIIADYHLGFVATQIGARVVEPHEVQRLIDSGTLPQDLAFLFQAQFGERIPPEAAALIAEAYNYGVLLGRSPDRAAVPAMSLGQSRRQALPPLSPQERAARQWAEQHAANTIVGLGNRVADDATSMMIEADSRLRDRYQRDIREELDLNLERRKSWRDLARRLGQRTADWARNFGRIAATEKEHALQEGLVASLIEREGDPKGVFVAKLPTPDACPRCVALHLIAGPGSAPRVFRLSALIANGSNVGRKQAQWRAVVGATHPFCSCTLVHVPSGFVFNENSELVPGKLRRSELVADDLRKAGGNLSYGRVVPERGVVIAVQDPVKRAIIEAVVAETPRELFDRRVGVTYITHDQPRVDNPMDEHDLAYWTGNEIRIATTLRNDKLAEVMRHELGHSLNVHLMHKWGGIGPVVRWHQKLYRVSRDEGFVTSYAATAPIENAAELTRLYLYQRMRLVANYPRAFALCDAAYRDIWRPRDATTDAGLLPVSGGRPGEAARQAQDLRERRARGGAAL